METYARGCKPWQGTECGRNANKGEELGRMEVVSKPLLLRSPSAVLMKLLGNQKTGTVIFIAMTHENVN